MPSGSQRARAIRAARRVKRAARALAQRVDRVQRTGARVGTAPCDPSKLAPSNSYGVPGFVTRGHYEDTPFRCVDCGKQEVWTATQQKWWYEVAKGYPYSIANRCRPCRRARRSPIATPAPRR